MASTTPVNHGSRPRPRRKALVRVFAVGVCSLMLFYYWHSTSIPPFAVATLDSPVFRDGWFRRAEAAAPPSAPLQKEIAELWREELRSPAVTAKIGLLANAIAARDRKRCAQLSQELYRALPDPAKDEYPEMRRQSNAGFLGALGWVCLGEGWMEGADDEFRAVLASIARLRGGPRKSYARDRASEGIARAEAMQARYASALVWLERARREDWSGCGNCEEGRDCRAYTMRCVWEAAQKPFDEARRELLDISVGRFSPQIGELTFGTGGYEKERAAVEATWTLAMLYRQRGDDASARKLLQKLAAPSLQRHDAARIATGLLRQAG